MNNAVKIRWLLIIISLSLFITAVIIRKTYSPLNNLIKSTNTLESNLQNKEVLVNRFIDNKNTLGKLKSIGVNDQYGLDLIEFTRLHKIYIATYQSDKLIYWSGIRVLPEEPRQIKNGSSFIKQPNGYYEAIKHTEGSFSVIFLIPVKNNYNYQNTYLKNTFSRDLLTDDNIDLADFTDHDLRAIYNFNHQYLFSVKLKTSQFDHLYYYIQVSIWLSCLLLLCAIVNSIAEQAAFKGNLYASVIIIAGFIVSIRFINLYWHWPDIYTFLALFNPYYFSANAIFPSLGDFALNLLLLSWLSLFIYNKRKKLAVQKAGVKLSFAIVAACMGVLTIMAYSLLALFQNLVLNSKINFDVTNILNLTFLSLVGVFLLCIAFYLFYLLSETCLVICSKLNITHQHKLWLVLGVAFAATVVEFIRGDFSLFFMLLTGILVIRGYAVYYGDGKFTPFMYICVIVICSAMSAVKLNALQSIKEKETRKTVVQALESSEDLNAEFLFNKIEAQITADIYVKKFFKDPANSPNFSRRFKKLYFNGYLSKFNLKISEYNQYNKPVKIGDNSLDYFKGLVLKNSFKVNNTKYFYKISSALGFQNYFAILPVSTDTAQIGTVVVELDAKPVYVAEPFPELLLEGKFQTSDNFKNYSYATYINGKLLNQSGKYTYNVNSNGFSGKLGKYIYKTTGGNPSYSHLIYQQNAHKLIVISKEDDRLSATITSLTFFFLAFLIFVISLTTGRWLWYNYRIFSRIKVKRWDFWGNFDKILYRTRIQLSMVFAVVVTLLIIGVLTFLSFTRQYITEQDDLIRDKITRIASAFEKEILGKRDTSTVEETQLTFDSFADNYSADLNLFDVNGQARLSTQPLLYETGLIAPRMDARAYINLQKFEKSAYINEETIGLLNFKSAYVPVRNSNSVVIGFLQLPYFANEAEYRDRIGAFLNTMINVYALVFIAIGLFAIVVARQITTPLTLIQQSLSRTMYGRKNEPIQWHHNDEIGSLIKEYNKMIAALENSAKLLAQSERESAWREMAKQVAHEIKNPLTPLKLGLQLLEKSWKDKDPRFDQKFERFSKSFVEQIDSLSKIATEFSDFAKMPETQMERFNIFEVISQAVVIFKQTANLEINYLPGKSFLIEGDKDQILRCFNNLLKNAIEAIPPEKQGVIDIAFRTEKNAIQIKIVDNGTGIPDSLRDRIFVPNFTTKSSGTGLGLAFVKNSIENARGSIFFETKMGIGTVFYISFPGEAV